MDSQDFADQVRCPAEHCATLCLRPAAAATYLEAALSSGAAERSCFEHELAVLYLLRIVGVQQQQQQQQQQQGRKPQAQPAQRQQHLANGQADDQQQATAVLVTKAGEGAVPGEGTAAVAAQDGQAAADPSQQLPEYKKLKALVSSQGQKAGAPQGIEAGRHEGVVFWYSS